MAQSVLLLIGTKKGAFFLQSNADRSAWQLQGPYCDAWPINHVTADPATGAVFAGGGNEWYGPAVWKSVDQGASWTHSSNGLAYDEIEGPIKSVWSIAAAPGALYAGVQPAGLFRSDDGGETWHHLHGLRDHPSRPEWQPGGGGLILHSLALDPEDPDRMWAGISTGGVFFSPDGGQTFEPRNRGTRADFLPEGQNYPDYGQCVHCVVHAPGARGRLYQQNHCGMYRSDDGGKNWHSIEAGLPSAFGFPVACHPSDPYTVYLVPLTGDVSGRWMPDGRAAVWRSRDGGDTWMDLRQGLPQEHAYFGVLRQALAVDRLDPAGVYFGTGSGTVFASSNEGESWTPIAQHLPTITSVETMIVET